MITVKVNSSNGGLNEITVLHLKESEVSANEQGGIKDLKNFLEKKANQKKGQNEQDVRIIKVCLASESAGYRCRSNFALTGLLSLHANILERRPRFTNFATTIYG